MLFEFETLAKRVKKRLVSMNEEVKQVIIVIGLRSEILVKVVSESSTFI